METGKIVMKPKWGAFLRGSLGYGCLEVAYSNPLGILTLPLSDDEVLETRPDDSKHLD